MAGARLTSPGRPVSYWNEKCKPKDHREALKDFKKFFKDKTGIAWDDRCDGLPHDPTKFKYHAPALGHPVGQLPPGKKPPIWDKDEDTELTNDAEGLVNDTESEVEDQFDSEGSSKSPSGSSVSSGASSRTASP